MSIQIYICTVYYTRAYRKLYKTLSINICLHTSSHYPIITFEAKRKTKWSDWFKNFNYMVCENRHVLDGV